MRDNLRFRRDSNARSGSQSGGNFTGPGNSVEQGVRNQSKSQKRDKRVKCLRK